MGKTVAVDKTRFDDAIKRRGLIAYKMSIDMGYGKSNLGMAVKSGHFTATQAVLLESLFGIKPEEYEPMAEEPVKTEATIDMNELYKTVYTAVFNAVKQAWKES